MKIDAPGNTNFANRRREGEKRVSLSRRNNSNQNSDTILVITANSKHCRTDWLTEVAHSWSGLCRWGARNTFTAHSVRLCVCKIDWWPLMAPDKQDALLKCELLAHRDLKLHWLTGWTSSSSSMSIDRLANLILQQRQESLPIGLVSLCSFSTSGSFQ